MSRSSRLSRRTFLRASGVSVSLPLLQGMSSSEASPAQESPTQESPAQESPEARRMLAICAPLGIHTPNLFPKKTGSDYEVTPYLEPLQHLRNKISVLSGLKHPMVDGGHHAERSFLTGAAHPSQPSFRNSISVDLYAAERMGHQTRFPFLALSLGNYGLSFTRSGVQVPAESRPSRVFDRMFLEGTEKEKADQMRRVKDGQSIMDLVREQTKSIQRKTSRQDQRTLDQFFTSVRELEQRLAMSEEWAKRPKPKVDQPAPTDIEDRANLTGRMQLMYDLMFLALQTDSTRLVTFKGAGGAEVVQLQGVEDGWHNLSHHGKDPTKLEQLAIIEKEEFRLLGEFIKRLDEVQEGSNTLLDQTAILVGSNLGNASSHNNTNLPIVVAGGHFKHGQHLAFDPERHPPLANLLVSFLQHLEIEVDQFSTGTGTMRGLELT